MQSPWFWKVLPSGRLSICHPLFLHWLLSVGTLPPAQLPPGAGATSHGLKVTMALTWAPDPVGLLARFVGPLGLFHQLQVPLTDPGGRLGWTAMPNEVA